jgi:hypothetical protein
MTHGRSRRLIHALLPHNTPATPHQAAGLYGLSISPAASIPANLLSSRYNFPERLPGSDGYEEEHTKNREEAFVTEDLVRPAGEEGHSFFENGTYAQDCGLPGNKCLVLWAIIFDTMILEHYLFLLKTDGNKYVSLKINLEEIY